MGSGFFKLIFIGGIFMSTSMLKVIACLLMLIDHLGATIFTDFPILRVIGRLSFPIFAYLIAIGYKKTNSFSKYLNRLIIFAVISQIPFSFAFSTTAGIYDISSFLEFVIGFPNPHLNIFFTLAFGLIAIHIWNIVESKLAKVILVIALGTLANSFHTDYGIYGVAMILAFYIFKESKVKTFIAQATVYIMFDALQAILYIKKFPSATIDLRWFNQGLSLLALFFIFSYNEEKGKNLKYFFYAFYPVHLLIIGLIKIFS